MANELVYSLLSTGDYVTEGGIYIAGFTEVGEDGGSVKAAFRFSNVAIPNGYNVSSATLHIRASSKTGSNRLRTRTYGIDEDNTGIFSSNPFGRAKTTATTDNDIDIDEIGTYFEVNVTNQVKEIVARGGWSSGNSIGFFTENNGSDSTTYIANGDGSSLLSVRLNAEPNFQPTPISVAAPSLPAVADVGMKFSRPGVSVLEATEADLYLTTRKRQVKLVSEDMYTSVGAGNTTIPHNLGYEPLVTVFGLDPTPGSDWVRLPLLDYFADHQSYFLDENNLYLHASDTGQKFYYRIFLDKIKT